MNLPHRILQLMTKGTATGICSFDLNAHVHRKFSFTHTLNQKIYRQKQPLKNDRHYGGFIVVGNSSSPSTLLYSSNILQQHQLLSLTRSVHSVISSNSSCIRRVAPLKSVVILIAKKNLQKSIFQANLTQHNRHCTNVQYNFFVNQNKQSVVQFLRNIYCNSSINMGWPSEFDLDPKVNLYFSFKNIFFYLLHNQLYCPPLTPYDDVRVVSKVP